MLAGIITLWPASLIMHHTGQIDMNHLTPFQYWVKFLLVPSLAFGLFLFLACVFVPLRKKQAGLLVFALSLIFIGLGAYQHYTDDGLLANQYMVRYTGFFIGLITALIVSHRLFKGNNKWNSI